MNNPILNTIYDAVSDDLNDMRSGIGDVRWGSVHDGQDRIQFMLYGQVRTAVLRGRNRDLVLTGVPEHDASIALRCILDGDMELGARTAMKESSK
jgi:hypothetical protein